MAVALDVCPLQGHDQCGVWFVGFHPTLLCLSPSATHYRHSRERGLPHSALRTPRSALDYVRVANPTSGALNPGFDVTPAELITGIITPVGIFKPKDLWPRRRSLGWIGS